MSSIKKTSPDTIPDSNFFKNVILYLLFKRFTLKRIQFLYVCTITSSQTELNLFYFFFLQLPASRGHLVIQYQNLTFSKILYLTYFKIK